MSENAVKLTRKDLMGVMIKFSFFPMVTINYERFQSLQYFCAISGVLEKLYPEKQDRIDAAKRHMAFYNTTPEWMSITLGMNCAQEETIAAMEHGEERAALEESVNTVKASLMGPLAGIGDSLSQFCIAPLFSTIFASMAMDGVAIAPLLFLICEHVTLLAIKLVMGGYGRRLGTSMIDKLSEKMGVISEAASMIGVTVIAGLAATFVKMNVAITFSAGAIEEGVKQSTVDIQAMLDKVAPALLPVLYTALMYYLIKKKGVTTYWLVLITVVIGVALSCLGILA